jgi:hypothetical protein
VAIEIVDLPIENGEFPWFSVNVYQRVVGVTGVNSGYLLEGSPPRVSVGQILISGNRSPLVISIWKIISHHFRGLSFKPMKYQY